MHSNVHGIPRFKLNPLFLAVNMSPLLHIDIDAEITSKYAVLRLQYTFSRESV